MKQIIYEKEFKNTKYKVNVLMKKEVNISVYVAYYLFYSSMKKDYQLKMFYKNNGIPSTYMKENILPYLEVVKIERINNEKSDVLFKDDLIEDKHISNKTNKEHINQVYMSVCDVLNRHEEFDEKEINLFVNKLKHVLKGW